MTATRTRARLVLLLAMLLTLGLLGSTVGSSTALATGKDTKDKDFARHCPDHHGHPGKIENGKKLNDYVPKKGTIFCVKAGPYATGKLKADGKRTLHEYVRDAGIRVGNGKNVPDVSYVVIYKKKHHDKHK
ncbi:hypothetical protein [Egicoccus sp. AB-alg2]|uniref:hypothetical protein n=1 Tax=Egicoccus sp. AB-alg2 TaxID=3242693 RepID=UPI00359E6BFE